jgi:transposase InsO family protein
MSGSTLVRISGGRRKIIEDWRVEYNTERPHTALNNQAPAAYRAAWEQQLSFQSLYNDEHRIAITQ